MADEREQKAGCLGAILTFLFGPKRFPLPYRTRGDFLTPAERSFYHVLAPLVEGRLVVCPKVRLGDLFFVSRPTNRVAHRARIAQKHVDFVLCEPNALKPVVGIELDDSSHGRAERRERDAFVNQVFAAAGLPLLRVPVRRHYAPAELSDLLAPYLDPESKRPPVPPRDEAALPRC